MTGFKKVETAGSPPAPLLLVCEHASNAVPDRLQPTDEDRLVLETHWGWDIGSGEVTTHIARHFSCPALLGGFSRLVIDLNRELNDDTLILERVSFNQDVTDAERARRIEEIYEPYHQAIDQMITERARRGGEDPLLLSVHSFTPELNGKKRAMEIGVLYDEHGPPANRLASALELEGFRTALNEPYSGFDGVISSAKRHGGKHELPYLELEIRQDLLQNTSSRRDIAERVCVALAAIL